MLRSQNAHFFKGGSDSPTVRGRICIYLSAAHAHTLALETLQGLDTPPHLVSSASRHMPLASPLATTRTRRETLGRRRPIWARSLELGKVGVAGLLCVLERSILPHPTSNTRTHARASGVGCERWGWPHTAAAARSVARVAARETARAAAKGAARRAASAHSIAARRLQSALAHEAAQREGRCISEFARALRLRRESACLGEHGLVV